MPKGLIKTFNYLLRTRNESAVSLLVAGLESHHAPIRSRALQVLARRAESKGHEALMRRLPTFGESEIARVGDVKHRMHDSLEKAIVGDDPVLCESAIRIVLLLREYALFPALVNASERKESTLALKVASTLVQLSKLLRDEADLPASHRSKGDPYFARRTAITALARSLDHFRSHKRLEVVEAYLLLVAYDDPTLTKLLANPHHPAIKQLQNSLSSSPAPGIMRLLVNFLEDARAPSEILSVVAERTDAKFLQYLLTSIRTPISLRVLQNIERLRHVAWLQEHRDVLFQLVGPAQAVAVQLATASSIGRPSIYSLLSEMLESGEPDGRRAACEALEEFVHPHADALIKKALNDSDASVRAAATAQLKHRSVPDRLPKLMAMLESDDEKVREAARSSLSDYSFNRYASNYDSMSESKRRSTGRVVGKSDLKAVDGLKRELKSPSPTQRLRATEMAVYLRLADAISDSLVKILLDSNEDVSIRVGAAEALATATTAEARAALEMTAAAGQVGLREAAQHSLSIFGSTLPDEPLPTDAEITTS